MIVLGFDTATPATVVGLRLADGTTLQARDEPAAGERPGHTTRLLDLANELLAGAGLRWGALERIAVGVGPGTFTGLRIGLATARGLAQSLGVEVVGVSTPRVLAEAVLRGPRATGTPSGAAVPGEARRLHRNVLAVIDARRGEAFVAAYAAVNASPLEDQTDATPEETPQDDRLAPPVRGRAPAAPRELARELAPVRALTPDGLVAIPTRVGGDRDWLAVGDGALRFRECLEAIAVTVPVDTSPLHRVDAGVLCELALSASAGELEAVLPDYRRRPDAEIALENKQ